MKKTKNAELRAALIMMLCKLTEDIEFTDSEKTVLKNALEALTETSKENLLSIEEEKSSKKLDLTALSEDPSDLKVTVTNLLKQLGVPAHIKGYSYLRTAIQMTVKDPSLMDAVTKELYPEVAKKYNTTSSRVERAIRHAVEISWSQSDEELIDELFGYSISKDKGKPTNSNFVAALTDYIRLQLS